MGDLIGWVLLVGCCVVSGVIGWSLCDWRHEAHELATWWRGHGHDR